MLLLQLLGFRLWHWRTKEKAESWLNWVLINNQRIVSQNDESTFVVDECRVAAKNSTVPDRRWNIVRGPVIAPIKEVQRFFCKEKWKEEKHLMRYLTLFKKTMRSILSFQWPGIKSNQGSSLSLILPQPFMSVPPLGISLLHLYRQQRHEFWALHTESRLLAEIEVDFCGHLLLESTKNRCMVVGGAVWWTKFKQHNAKRSGLQPRRYDSCRDSIHFCTEIRDPQLLMGLFGSSAFGWWWGSLKSSQLF